MSITPPGDMHVWACSEFLQIPDHFADAVVHTYTHTHIHTHTHTHTHTLCPGASVMAEGVGRTRGASSLPEVSGGQDSGSGGMG